MQSISGYIGFRKNIHIFSINKQTKIRVYRGISGAEGGANFFDPLSTFGCCILAVHIETCENHIICFTDLSPFIFVRLIFSLFDYLLGLAILGQLKMN